MIILDRNVTCADKQLYAGQNVEGVLSESACNDLLKRGWAHKSQAQTVADQDETQTDEQTDDAQSNEGDNSEENLEPAAENDAGEGGQQSEQEQAEESQDTDEEAEEGDEVIIDSLKELDEALEQTPAKTSGKSRKRGK